jgi:hypothetical protein
LPMRSRRGWRRVQSLAAPGRPGPRPTSAA